MRFIYVVYLTGFTLAAMPLLHHAYALSRFSDSAVIALSTQSSVNFPEAPLGIYIWCALLGSALIVLGLFLGVRTLQAMRAPGSSRLAA